MCDHVAALLLNGLRDYGIAQQIGLEASPDVYVATLVEVFREVRRVLTDDGVCWLNLGDSYNSSPSNQHGDQVGAPYRQTMGRRSRKVTGLTSEDFSAAARACECQANIHNRNELGRGDGWAEMAMKFQEASERVRTSIKSKDLCGIPWRVAFALQADGWYLRSDVIWAKPNPMPESVTDRPTKAHEYVFMLTKSARYYYDAPAIAEPYAESTLRESEQVYRGLGLKDYSSARVQNPSDTKRRIIEGIRMRWSLRIGGGKGTGNTDRQDGNRHDAEFVAGNGRNRRSVWTIPTLPYAGAHFATMPEKLVEPCILAGSRFGDLVFDPFSGSGTVLAVAARLGRRAVGTDLNAAYHELAKQRTAQRGLRFEAEVDARPGEAR